VTLPGIQIDVVDQQQPKSAPTNTATTFLVGLSEKGSITTPTLIRNPRQLLASYGAEVPYSQLHIGYDFLKREGGKDIYFQRGAGDAAASSHADIANDSSGVSLIATAASVGSWGDGLSVKVERSGSSFVIAILRSGSEIERSASLTTVPQALAYARASQNLEKFTVGAGGGIPKAGTYALSGGTDDRLNIDAEDWSQAFDAIPEEAGPGQLVPFGITDPLVHAAALEHCDQRNRYALLDAPVASVNAMIAQAATLRAAGLGRNGSMVAPVVIAPNGASTTTVPGSLLVAGTTARTDAAEGPGQPGAGAFGIARWASDVVETYTTDERERLNEAGIIVIRPIYGKPRVYGNRTLADPVAEFGNHEMSGSRVLMGLRAEAGAILEQYVERRINGRGSVQAALEQDVAGMCTKWWARGDLYGATPSEAFAADAGIDVNPPEDLAAGVLSIAVAARISPVAERVVMTITKVAASDQIVA
jgi:hypothetical protein